MIHWQPEKALPEAHSTWKFGYKRLTLRRDTGLISHQRTEPLLSKEAFRFVCPQSHHPFVPATLEVLYELICHLTRARSTLHDSDSTATPDYLSTSPSTSSMMALWPTFREVPPYHRRG